MKKDIISVIKKGFMHIFAASFVDKILSKQVLGEFTYANNILSMFLLINGLGLNFGIMQYCVKAKTLKQKQSYFKAGLIFGIAFNFIIGVLILIFCNVFDMAIKNSAYLLGIMCFLPVLFYFIEATSSYLRANLKNKQYSTLTVINTAGFVVFTLIGAYYKKAFGVAVFRYFAYVFSIAYCLLILKPQVLDIIKAKVPAKNLLKPFFKFSVVAVLTNAISSLLYLIDTFLVGKITQNAEILASYKMATLVPFALNFLPLSIMIFAYPYFAKNSENKAIVKAYAKKIKLYLGVTNFFISATLIAFAPIIIKLLFGDEYTDSIVPFRILAIGYFVVGTFRIPVGNIIVALQKIKFNFYVAVISGVANIILDIILIKYYGSVGAAIATSCIFALSAILSNYFLYFKLLKQKKEN